MNTAYIMRGLPGSGKSTVSRLLAPDDHICSTDKFCMVDGEYRWEAAKAAERHAQNFAKFAGLVQKGVEAVVVDNTNMTRWEYEKYERVAKEKGYNIVKILVGNPQDPAHQETCYRRGTHGVPLESIRRMGSKFEP